MIAHDKELTKEVANDIKKHGWRVFIAKKGTYGFVTDSAGSEVVSFQVDLGRVVFHGNYTTDNPLKTGTGWRLDYPSSYGDLFNGCPPLWAVNDVNWKYTTLKQYLKKYQRSSLFKELK